jgi:two-component system chemotaxis family response regulator WspR
MQDHCARPGDLVCRWGGEEFAVILPATDVAGATHLARELVEVVRALGLAHGSSPAGPVVTVSVGAAAAKPEAGSSASALVEKADAALYAAKQAGRNQAQSADVPPA